MTGGILLNSEISERIDSMPKATKPLPASMLCPCDSGRTYKDCCKQKGIVWRLDNRGRPHKIVKLNDDLVSRLEDSEEEFVGWFGRSPGKSDLVFGALNYLDQPRDFWLRIREASRVAGVREHISYASQKTDRILAESNMHLVSDVEIEEWNDAADEYDEIKSFGVDPFLGLDFRTWLRRRFP